MRLDSGTMLSRQVHPPETRGARVAPVRGDPRIWAAAAVHAIGSINFLFDRSQTPHLTVEQLCSFTGVSKSTMANKARLIRETLKTGQFDPSSAGGSCWNIICTPG
jgi:hypothetical protein